MSNKKYQLTLGFELEGSFTDDLVDAFNLSGEWKYDGSVIRPTLKGSNNNWQEFASCVYNDKEKFLKDLMAFDEPEYANNTTCGFHLHIGLVGGNKNKNKELLSLVTSWPFISELQAESNTWCKCQAERNEKEGIRWAKKYQNKKDMLMNYKSPDKYKFLHYHRAHDTAEFRFLAPCKHKAENAEKLINAVEKQVFKLYRFNGDTEVEKVKGFVRENIIPIKVRPFGMDFDPGQSWDIGRKGKKIIGTFNRLELLDDNAIADIEVIVNGLRHKDKQAGYRKTWLSNIPKYRTKAQNLNLYNKIIINNRVYNSVSGGILGLNEVEIFNANTFYGKITARPRKGKRLNAI